MNPKFADAVAKRFSGKTDETAGDSESPEEDAGETEEGGTEDAENGRMFRAALKNGDNTALCEALRRICG